MATATSKSKGLKNIVYTPLNFFRGLSKRNKVLTLILIALLVYWRISATQNSGLLVETTTVQNGQLVESINASGEIKSDKSAQLAFQTVGEVTEVNFKKGDVVKKGDVIAKLDTTSLYNSYLQADAALRAAEANLASVYDNLQGKKDKETFAEISTRTTAETTKDRAYFAFTATAKALEGAYIRAPFDGFLTDMPNNFTEGSLVSLPTAALFHILDPATVYFEAEVNEVDVLKLTSNAKTKVQLDSFDDETFEGLVLSVNFQSTPTSTGGTAYLARISLPSNTELKFRPGMNGDVDIILSEKNNVLLVPVNAVIEEDGKSYVWKVENGKAEKAEIQTGISSINDMEVVSGLQVADTIIVRPPTTIREGVKIKQS